MIHKLNDPFGGVQKLTQSILQATELLGMYQAELARILHVKCQDISEFAAAKRHLEPNTTTWQQAELFIRFYQALFDKMKGNEIAMHHWLRAENKQLNAVPLYLMVDDDQLQLIVEYIANEV